LEDELRTIARLASQVTIKVHLHVALQ
jgi:hypothetical protein